MSRSFDLQPIVNDAVFIFAIFYLLTEIRCFFSKYRDERLWHMAHLLADCSFIIFGTTMIYLWSLEDVMNHFPEFSRTQILKIYTILFIVIDGPKFVQGDV